MPPHVATIKDKMNANAAECTVCLLPNEEKQKKA